MLFLSAMSLNYFLTTAQMFNNYKTAKQSVQLLDNYRIIQIKDKHGREIPANVSRIQSQHGNLLLVVNGYKYRKNSLRRERNYWICSAAGCPARLVQVGNGDDLTLTNDQHNHSSMYACPPEAH